MFGNGFRTLCYRRLGLEFHKSRPLLGFPIIEREREIDGYIYIYIERERERESMQEFILGSQDIGKPANAGNPNTLSSIEVMDCLATFRLKKAYLRLMKAC